MKKKTKSILDEHRDQFTNRVSSPVQEIIDSVVKSAQSALADAVYGPIDTPTPRVKPGELQEIKQALNKYNDPETKYRYIINYISLEENRLHIIETLCSYIGLNRAQEEKNIEPIDSDYLKGRIDYAKKESDKVHYEISKTNIINYYRLNREYILSLGPLPPVIQFLDELFKIAALEAETINSDDILSSIADEYVRRLAWRNDKQILLNQIKILFEKGRIDFSDDCIIIIDHDPYKFIIGLIEQWENKDYIPKIKHGKNDRIINHFKWRTAKFEIQPYDPKTLDSRRPKGRAEGLKEIENLLK